jgi:hypothetical protein
VTCFQPLKGYRSIHRGDSGKPLITFNPLKAINNLNPISLPCGQCIGCRLDRAQQWAIRCYHEASMYQHNAFVTLTYDNTHIPANYSLSIREWQLFMKKLRKHFAPSKIRFFACGEYGPKTLRPHYHALLFNCYFQDQKLLKTLPNNQKLYTSEILTSLWSYGLPTIGSVNYQTAGYCARYVVKKWTGKLADNHYFRVSPIDGKQYRVMPEFSVQSRMPGLGTTWFEKYKSDCFPSDFLMVDGHKVPVPRFYALKLEEEQLQKIKRLRKRASLPHKPNSTPERLHVREIIKHEQAKQLVRTLKEDDDAT